MPDLSILMEIAELYQVEIREILNGEKEGMQMDKTSEKTKDTLAMIADYGDEEKERALKIGNSAFGIMFVCCAAAIIIQMVAFNDLWLVAGETVTLILGGILYILLMAYNGVWDKGSKIRTGLPQLPVGSWGSAFYFTRVLSAFIFSGPSFFAYG